MSGNNIEQNTTGNIESQRGVIAAILAFIVWGFISLYWKGLQSMPALDQVSHRIFWSFIGVLILIICTGRSKKTFLLLKDIHVLWRLAVSSLLISGNWYLFVWTIANNRAIEASLGYFINPLISALLGYVFLKEKFDKIQGLGMFFALLGVSYGFYSHGKISILAFSLAISFGLYGLMRRKIKIDALSGLFIETLVVLPVVVYVVYSSFENKTYGDASIFYLILSGPLTIIPMLLFTYAAQRIKLMILGMCQYISPTVIFFISIYVFNEPFDLDSLIMFSGIWIGLVIFTYRSYRVSHPKLLKP